MPALPLVLSLLAAHGPVAATDHILGPVVGPVIVGPIVASYPTECDPDDKTRCSKPLSRGDKAPFDGQLLTPQMAVWLSLAIEECEARRAADKKRLTKTYELDKDFLQEQLALEQQRAGDLWQKVQGMEKAKRKHEWWNRITTAIAFSASVALVAVVLVAS